MKYQPSPLRFTSLLGAVILYAVSPGSEEARADAANPPPEGTWRIAQTSIDLSENFLAAVASLANQSNENEPLEPVPNPHNGIEPSRLQTMPIDQALVGTWYIFPIDRAPGTPPGSRLTIASDKTYAYSAAAPGSNAYTGTLLHGVPFRHAVSGKTYWIMEPPNAKFYMRSGSRVNGLPTVMIYHADTNRIVAFGVPGR